MLKRPKKLTFDLEEGHAIGKIFYNIKNDLILKLRVNKSLTFFLILWRMYNGIRLYLESDTVCFTD
jgi:hypothetical protein